MVREFKDFIKDESLEKSKQKSFIRLGWDGRQGEVDEFKRVTNQVQTLSLENFERYEEARGIIAQLEETVKSNDMLVRKAVQIQTQNEELAEENTKIQKCLESIAQDLAEYHINLTDKDNLISQLEAEIKDLKKK